MSSFICSAKHYNSIEYKLHNHVYKDDFYIPYGLRDICPLWYTKRNSFYEAIFKEISNHIDTIRELNAVCVSLQYAHLSYEDLDEEVATQITKVKEITSVKTLSLLGLYNALCCADYQIETEHLEGLRELTPEEINAMTFLHTMKQAVAFYILYKMENDKTNTWSID